MTRESVVERIKEVMSRYLEVPVSSIDSFKELIKYNIDSIDMIELVANLEDEFDLELDPEDFMGVDSIISLAEVITEKIDKKQAGAK